MFRLGAALGPVKEEYDVVIIGGGPAGLAAGMQVARLGGSVIILERSAPGGRLLQAHMIENYPGLPPVSGQELALKLYESATRAGAKVRVPAEVVGIDSDGGSFVVKCRDGSEYRCKAVIVATGVSRARAGVKGEELRGVSYCAACDGPLYKGEDVAVIGHGEEALHDVKLLQGLGCRVHWVLHGEDSGAAGDLGGSVAIYRDRVEEIVGEDGVVKGVRLASGKVVPVKAVFIALGAVPSSQLVRRLGVEVDERGFIVVDKYMRTSVPRIYAAGDVTGVCLQAAAAIGQGVTAATTAVREVLRR